ncbi:ATP-binding protein [Pseudodesulfovibrio sp. F-1]|uniref:ATP-binding protein n=1 Tax=Pseudodesulfovibrio alkaliphilus TaxID=2661613 RepID=A0A7K1KP27_9BACT|nr:ATP-binding protein [Pseudodesulfovibrio alkaliphilus]MUM77856.1 ATP-binding protein [Pseudodesulfovibrio alkaliphilus]
MPVFAATPDLSSLQPARDHVLAMATQAGLDPSTLPRLDLALEEVLVNVARHAYGGAPGTFEIECKVRDGLFCCLIRDRGTPFDPLAAPPPDTGADMDQRAVGGLGIFLVTTMADHCRYTRADNANELTICFALPAQSA